MFMIQQGTYGGRPLAFDCGIDLSAASAYEIAIQRWDGTRLVRTGPGSAMSLNVDSDTTPATSEIVYTFQQGDTDVPGLAAIQAFDTSTGQMIPGRIAYFYVLPSLPTS